MDDFRPAKLVPTKELVRELRIRGARIVVEMDDDVVDLDIVGPCTVIVIKEPLQLFMGRKEIL